MKVRKWLKSALLRTPLPSEAGFSLPEFLISSIIIVVIAATVFSMLGETQRDASYQTEVHSVLENTRIAMDTIERHIRQAGNNPLGAVFEGVTITSASEVRLRSDLTGSAAGSGSPDKGDPDGDTNDSGEDVTIRYNATGRSVDVVPGAGTAQSIANYISALSLQYFDASGAATTVGAEVRKIRLSITGATTQANPKTNEIFSQQLSSDIQLATRQ